MNKEICKAEIRPHYNAILYGIYYIILIILLVSSISNHRVGNLSDEIIYKKGDKYDIADRYELSDDDKRITLGYSEEHHEKLNILFLTIQTRDSTEYSLVDNDDYIFSWEKDEYLIINPESEQINTVLDELSSYYYGEWSYDSGTITRTCVDTYEDNIIFLLVLLVLLFSLPLILTRIVKIVAARCFITLQPNGIKGLRKKIISQMLIDLPIEKIDSILISKSILDFLRGGKTIVIRSNSGVIRFPWVQNAEEFMQATLAEIEKYKKNVAQQTPTQVKEKDNSATEKMRELKKMLDEGFITQEEFDAKRKEFLDKM
ncbi:MAG: SHOCT domain-containing protein [Ruminococcus sp.]|nr:SHOCT domain-containing protein [Ruminococcus sp.]